MRRLRKLKLIIEEKLSGGNGYFANLSGRASDDLDTLSRGEDTTWDEQDYETDVTEDLEVPSYGAESGNGSGFFHMSGPLTTFCFTSEKERKREAREEDIDDLIYSLEGFASANKSNGGGLAKVTKKEQQSSSSSSTVETRGEFVCCLPRSFL